MGRTVLPALLAGFALGALVAGPHEMPGLLPTTVQLPAMTRAGARLPVVPSQPGRLAPGRAQHFTQPMWQYLQPASTRQSLRSTVANAAVGPQGKEIPGNFEEMDSRTSWGLNFDQVGDWSMWGDRLKCSSRTPKVGEEVFNKFPVQMGSWTLAAGACASVMEVTDGDTLTGGSLFKLKNPKGEVSNWLYVKEYYFNTPERTAMLKTEAANAAAAAAEEAAEKKAKAEKAAKEAAAKKEKEAAKKAAEAEKKE
jgi:hypothetical protein